MCGVSVNKNKNFFKLNMKNKMNKLNLCKTVLFILAAVLSISVFITGCGKKESANNTENKKQNTQQTEKSAGEQNTQSNSKSDNQDKEHVMIRLSTMQCSTCKKNIETAVKKLDGIESINVVVKEKVAHINYDKSKTDLSKIENTITSAGYDANDKKADPEAYKKLDDCCKLPEDRKE